jgi:queuine tRNA-ribosyltransferase
MSNFKFKILKKSPRTKARRGIIKTPHGLIETPAFIPVGTQAALKGLTPDEAKTLGIQIIFANTYHLFLRPGEKLIQKIGGLHKFMHWDRPLITDSGGFQVFSLGKGLEEGVGKIASIFPQEKSGKISNVKQRVKNIHKSRIKITEKGVEFQSHINGDKIFLTPEKSIQIQRALGADLILAFDECTSPLDSYSYTKKALAKTHLWEKRSWQEFQKGEPSQQALYGIIQGGAYKDLRELSAQTIGKMDFFGIAIGGSLGKTKKNMHQILDWTIPLLPEEKPRHLLGIGGIEDIKKSVKQGIDTFDCAAPTREARNGSLLTKKGRLNILKSSFKNDPAPIEKGCQCYTCQNYSRAYLRHLFQAREMLAPRLATIHNLHFMTNLMKEIRESI